MMKLHYAPGACSLADHIALLEVGAKFEAEAVDIRTKRTASGEDFLTINPKGYVPALVLDDCEILTENIAVLDWIADQYPQLRRNGVLSRTRQLEMLAFISTEIHGAFKPMWHGGTDAEKQKAREKIESLFALASKQLIGDYLFGDELSVADCYLFVMLRWAENFDMAVPEKLRQLQRRMEQRPAVKAALETEEVARLAQLFARNPGKATRTNEPVALPAKVTENAPQHRFERPIHNNTIAAAYYRNADGKLVFIHTEVPNEFSGQGIASELARGTFDLLRETGRKAVLVCPFMVYFANTHPEYADVIDG
jgi:glutathione S-transferase